MNDLLAALPSQFRSHLADHGWTYDDETSVDLLAAMLGSQFLLLAGPSGTGKSTASSALASFFSGHTRTSTINVAPNWQQTSDLVGYYSNLSGRFVRGPFLDDLSSLAAAGEQVPPTLILEEANLSPMEAYLTDIIQDLSAGYAETIGLRIHDEKTPAKASGTDVPARLELAPFPRLLATINVDAEAPAPANKIVGRACVVVLEPPDHSTAAGVEEPLFADPPPTTPRESGIIGDPRDAISWWISTGDKRRDLIAVLDDETSRLANRLGFSPVSKRAQQRCLLYMAFYSLLAQGDPLDRSERDALAESAANALLHFVVPALSPHDFRLYLDEIEANGTPSSLVRSRATRLATANGSDTLMPLDFWACLT